MHHLSSWSTQTSWWNYVHEVYKNPFETLATTSLIQTTIHVFAPSGTSYKWLKHISIKVTNDCRVYLHHDSDPFKTLTCDFNG